MCPPPLRCFKCQKYGHAERFCKGLRRCARCGGGHKASECSGAEKKCSNCGEAHRADSRDCQENVKQREIQRIRTQEGVTFAQARLSYAQVLLSASSRDAVAPAVSVGRPSGVAPFAGRSEVDFPPLVEGGPSSSVRGGSAVSERAGPEVASSPLVSEGLSSLQASKRAGLIAELRAVMREELRAEMEVVRKEVEVVRKEVEVVRKDLMAVVRKEVEVVRKEVAEVVRKEVAEVVRKEVAVVRKELLAVRKDMAGDSARVQVHVESCQEALKEELWAMLKSCESKMQSRMESLELEGGRRSLSMKSRESRSPRSRSRSSRPRSPRSRSRSSRPQFSGEVCRDQVAGGVSGGRGTELVGPAGVAGVGGLCDKDGV